jgi:hypothetical protein
MTNNLTKALTLGSMNAQIKATVRNAQENAPSAIIEWRDLIAWGHIIDAHLTAIQKNADATLRLRALEHAMDSVRSHYSDRREIVDAIDVIRLRADELLRERAEGKGDE